MLASIKAELGDLDRVTGWLRVFGMVNAAKGFDNLPAVINGFSNQLLSIFGPNIGSHSRSAIGVSELPFSVPVEIEATVRVQNMNTVIVNAKIVNEGQIVEGDLSVEGERIKGINVSHPSNPKIIDARGA